MHWAIRQLELELGIEGPGRGGRGAVVPETAGMGSGP